MIERLARRRVERALGRQSAVALIGPRQVGKTTLARAIARERPSVYLDLESSADRRKLSDPELFLGQQRGKLVILDEIHRVPELFQTLRVLIDRDRREGHPFGQFLVLGSASIDLLRQSSESLAGRIEFVDMGPLELIELEAGVGTLNRLWVRGGFPGSFLAASDADSLSLRQNFIRTYLERDVPQFGVRVPAEVIERLWTMLAHQQGAQLNVARLAGAMGVSAHAVNHYISLLSDLLLVRKLSPLHANLGKRLVKAPKVYLRDSGLTHALLNLATWEDLVGHPVVGASWEGFVIENLIAAAPARTSASFYRTATGVELDLVLDFAGARERWAVEIKHSLAPALTKGFHQARQDVQPTRTWIVYPGEDRYPLEPSLEVIGLRGLVSELQSLSQ